MTVTKEISIPDEWAKKFDLVVKNCSDVLSQEGLGSIGDSLKVMNGIRTLKGFFNQEDVKSLVVASQDSHAGFLTDRSPALIRKAEAKARSANKTCYLRPYTYEEIVEALIPLALEGYRLHGNEINIISGKGMPVIAGKHRRINDLTDSFQENIGTPAIKDGFAFIKCKGKWTIDGQTQSIGYDEDDQCHLKIAFGKWDSIDKVLGLARSKFYKLVLIRITGRFIPDEPEGDNVVQGTAEEVKEPANPPQNSPAAAMNSRENLDSSNTQENQDNSDSAKNAQTETEAEAWKDLDMMWSSELCAAAVQDAIAQGKLNEKQVFEIIKSKDNVKAAAAVAVIDEFMG